MIWDHFSLMTGSVEHIFIYFLVICRFSSGEYHFGSFAHFKKSNYLLFDFWNWVACVPHVLLILTPYQLYYLQIFSFTFLLMVSFAVQIFFFFFSLIEFHLSIFICTAFNFGVHLKKIYIITKTDMKELFANIFLFSGVL